MVVGLQKSFYDSIIFLLIREAVLFRSLNISISPDWFRKTNFAKKDKDVGIGKGFVETIRNSAGTGSGES